MSRTPLEMWEQVLSPAVQKSLETASQQWEVDCSERMKSLEERYSVSLWGTTVNTDHMIKEHILPSINEVLRMSDEGLPGMREIETAWVYELARAIEYMAVLLAQSEKIIEETNHVL